MALTGLFAKFFGRTVSEGAAFAAGVAIGPVLSPIVQEERNAVWSKYPFVPPDVGTLAVGVAQGQVDPGQAQEWALQHGISSKAFAALVNVANVGPGVATAFDLWRRGVIGEPGFRVAALRAGLEQEWIDDLVQIKSELLDPADIARGIHRGLIPDPGLLEGTASPGPGKVPAYPVYPIDALAEAEGHGVDRDRLGVLVGLQGLPMGSHEAAQAEFRGVIDHNDYLRAIAEGNTRNEWADAILEQSRQIPSPTNYVEARVRNWISPQEMVDGAARHGMTADDVNLLYLVHGRPITHNQVFIGKLRGGQYDGPTGDIDPAFLKSLQESNIRPEWYHLAWSERYKFPPFFQTVNALNKGWIDPTTATHWLTVQGYDPDAIKTIVENVSGTKTTAPDKHITSAQTSTVTAIRKAYLAKQLGDTEATNELEQAGLSAQVAAGVVSHWQQTLRIESLPAASTTPGSPTT